MTKIVLCAAVAYAMVAIAAILIDDRVSDARPRRTITIIVDVPTGLAEDALEVRAARTGSPVGGAIAWIHS
jgi:hypothetical protein